MPDISETLKDRATELLISRNGASVTQSDLSIDSVVTIVLILV